MKLVCVPVFLFYMFLIFAISVLFELIFVPSPPMTTVTNLFCYYLNWQIIKSSRSSLFGGQKALFPNLSLFLSELKYLFLRQARSSLVKRRDSCLPEILSFFIDIQGARVNKHTHNNVVRGGGRSFSASNFPFYSQLIFYYFYYYWIYSYKLTDNQHFLYAPYVRQTGILLRKTALVELEKWNK